MKKISLKKFSSDKQGFVYYWQGSAMLMIKELRSTMHSHYPLEIYIGLDDDFRIDFGDGWQEYRAVLIDSNQPHRLLSGQGCLALFLLNPNFYDLNGSKKEIFNNNKYLIPKDEIIDRLLEKINGLRYKYNTYDDAKILIDELVFLLFKLTSSTKVMDPRIKKLLSLLENVSENNLSAKQLAHSIHLSESRFAHLFKAEIGIPIRRYLLWLRLRKAIRIIFNGESLTTAAHHSGFSDSAHFSRTYKQMFGLCPSGLLKQNKLSKVVL